MPLAIAIGRRSVLLLATGVMLVSATLYAAVTDYGSHLAARMVLGLAAAQSEALILLLPRYVFLGCFEPGISCHRQV